MRKIVLASLVVLCVFQTLCRADMTIELNAPYLHDRFYSGSDKAFIGQAFDWSGVGQVGGPVGGGAWATMISPSYFVSAAHWHPNPGDVVTFAEGNSLSSLHQYTVASWSYQGTTDGVPSDLWVGKFITPIPASDHIAYYPLLTLPNTSDYLGQVIYVNGKPNAVGRNVIDNVRVASEPEVGTHNKSTISMEYDYNTTSGLGADECYLIPGDSGGPSFVEVGGRLALVGTHYYDEGTPDLMNWGMISGDTLVPAYLDQIEAAMVGETVTTIPEPVTLSLLALGALAVLRRNRRA